MRNFQGGSNVLRTRLPLVCIATDPFDLHVLCTPPALILSQDQTLHNKEPEGSLFLTKKFLGFLHYILIST